MNYIGEFQKKSMISLELLTKDEENQPIAVDNPPVAVIDHTGQNGIVQVDSVTLETMGDDYKYTKEYTIPSDWEYGKYIITYKVAINGVEHQTQETFNVMPYKSELSSDDFDPADEAISDASDYIPSSDFQSEATVNVVGNRIEITLSEDAKYNYSCSVILDKGIKSVSGKSLDTAKVLSFTTEYKPLYATPLEIRSVLRSIFKYFSTDEVYKAIRDAGQKARQLRGETTVDANNSRYREIRSTDTTLFSTQKYTVYEASRILLTKLIVRILNSTDPEEIDAGSGIIDKAGGSFSLGDFSISNGVSASSSLTSVTDNEESALEKLQSLLEENEKDLKFWRDAMLGHNRRGYASPTSASFRSDGGSPEGRDIE
ncbi:Ig-like domain-containing protein [Bacillus atrophaeus]|uniref:Ig-like domain-containing protein n=1 Tax=Bacillus atrophaeus TaxID=1452 RepID=UPI001C0F561F|nr:Ig-like domain-containing protein [Bacillus atrophaeus]MBU5262118.1 Ig-like domain-containing protein [Bacillus atrophaeus]